MSCDMSVQYTLSLERKRDTVFEQWRDRAVGGDIGEIPPRFRYEIRWRPIPNAMTSVASGWAASEAEAKAEAWAMAIEYGWTPPRWWQWWRWSESQRVVPTV